MRELECRVCLSRQDWLMIGRTDNIAQPFVVGTPAKPMRFEGRGRDRIGEVLMICAEGHMVFLQWHAQDPIPRLLQERHQERGRVVTLWSSTMGGKTVLVHRLMRCVAPPRNRHQEALRFAVTRVQDRVAERHLTIDPERGTANVQNECRFVLVGYLRSGRNALPGTEATDFLDDALRRAGVGAGLTDEQSKRELEEWGLGRQPYVPLYHFARQDAQGAVAERWSARLWICDEPGEIHQNDSITMDDPSQINPNSEALLWIVDAAATPDSIAQQLLEAGNDDRANLLTRSFRKAQFEAADRDELRTQANEMAAERWQVNADVLPRVTAEAARPGVEAAVILTKLDLVAAVLKNIEEHDTEGADGRSALLQLLDDRASMAVDLAAGRLIRLADHWMSDEREARLTPSARGFLGQLWPPPVAAQRDARLRIAHQLAVGLLDRFGSSAEFWNLIKGEAEIDVPGSVSGDLGGEGWQVDHLKDYYAMMLGHGGAVPARFGLRDVVCSVLGSALLVLYRYSADELELLGTRSPERYFLVSAMSTYDPSPATYLRDLKNSHLPSGGINHLFYWLISGFVTEDLR